MLAFLPAGPRPPGAPLDWPWGRYLRGPVCRGAWDDRETSPENSRPSPLASTLNSSTGKRFGAPSSHTQAHLRGPQRWPGWLLSRPWLSAWGPHTTPHARALPCPIVLVPGWSPQGTCRAQARYCLHAVPVVTRTGALSAGAVLQGRVARCLTFWEALGSEQTCSTHTLT